VLWLLDNLTEQAMLHLLCNIAGIGQMPISPNQCRAARGLFAMSRQELANASGVSLRTISSFEDTSDRLPTGANLAAIQTALQRLGALFQDGGVGWVPPFSGTQTRVILALQVRNGPRMVSASELLTKTGGTRADLELLAQLQILTGIDGYPTLTAIGLHMPGLLREHEACEENARKEIAAPHNYTVRLDDRTVFHARTAAVFRIEEDGTLSVLFDNHLPREQRADVIAGAREALRLYRERDPRIVRTWH
jgi:transcriptional regulator with XRE-family HTH domain